MAEGREATRARLRGSQEKSLVVTMGTVGFGLQPGRMNVPRAAGLELLLSGLWVPLSSQILGHRQVSEISLPLVASNRRSRGRRVLTVGYGGLYSHFFEVRRFPVAPPNHSDSGGREVAEVLKVPQQLPEVLRAREGLGTCLASELVYLQLYPLLSL